MARTRIKKRLKFSAEGSIQSQIVSNTDRGNPVSSVTSTASTTPVSKKKTPLKLFDCLVDSELTCTSGDLCIRHDYIPGKRKPDSGDPVDKLDVKSAAKQDASVAKITSPDASLETNSDLDADDAVRHEEAAFMAYMDQDIGRKAERENEQEETIGQETHVLNTP